MLLSRTFGRILRPNFGPSLTYTFLIHPVLKTAPNSVVNRVQVRAVRWPEVGQDEFWCDLVKIFGGMCSMVVMAVAAAGTLLH